MTLGDIDTWERHKKDLAENDGFYNDDASTWSWKIALIIMAAILFLLLLIVWWN